MGDPADDLLGGHALDDLIDWVGKLPPDQLEKIAGTMSSDSVAGEHYGGGLEEHFEDNLDMNPGEPGLPAETNFEQGLRGGHGAQLMDDFGPAYGGGDYPSTGFDYGSAYGALGTGASSVHGLHAPGVDFFNELQGGELHEDHGDLHRAADAADAGLQQAELTGFPGLLPGMAPRRRSRAAPSTGAMFVRAVTSNAARSSANIEDAQAQPRAGPSVDMFAMRNPHGHTSSADSSDVSGAESLGASSFASHSSLGSYNSERSGRSTRGIKRDWALLAGEKGGDDAPYIESPRGGKQQRVVAEGAKGGDLGSGQSKAPGSDGGTQSGKRNRMWTAAETLALVQAVEDHGVGRWSRIARLDLPELAGRTSVDFKDRWRNLCRIVGTGKQRGESDRALPSDVIARIARLVEGHRGHRDSRRVAQSRQAPVQAQEEAAAAGEDMAALSLKK